jgi:hypothetical protein
MAQEGFKRKLTAILAPMQLGTAVLWQKMRRQP